VTPPREVMSTEERSVSAQSSGSRMMDMASDATQAHVIAGWRLPPDAASVL
jgi:hypothetical protein